MDHSHDKSQSYIVLNKDPEYQEEWFCLQCDEPLIECQYCEALHLKNEIKSPPKIKH